MGVLGRRSAPYANRMKRAETAKVKQSSAYGPLTKGSDMSNLNTGMSGRMLNLIDRFADKPASKAQIALRAELKDIAKNRKFAANEIRAGRREELGHFDAQLKLLQAKLRKTPIASPASRELEGLIKGTLLNRAIARQRLKRDLQSKVYRSLKRQ